LTINKVVPQLDRRSIWNQLAATGVFQKHLPNRTVGFEAAEYIAASAVKKVWNRSQDLALGAFAAPGAPNSRIVRYFMVL
jgi:hypothetical protein